MRCRPSYVSRQSGTEKISRATIATAPTMALDSSGSCVSRALLPGGRQYTHNPQAKESGRPSRLNIPDVAYHGALRLIEQTTKSKAGLFSKLERCSVRWRDSEDDLAGFCCRSQIFIHEVNGP